METTKSLSKIECVFGCFVCLFLGTKPCNMVFQIFKYIIVLLTSRRRGITVLPTTRGIVQFYLYPLHLQRFLYRFLFSPCMVPTFYFLACSSILFETLDFSQLKPKRQEQINRFDGDNGTLLINVEVSAGSRSGLPGFRGLPRGFPKV